MPHKEVPSVRVSPAPGYPGNLSASQVSTLRELWKEWYATLNRASGHARSSQPTSTSHTPLISEADPATATSPRDTTGGDPQAKDDEAIEALLQAYSASQIEEALWDQAKMEDPDALFCRFLRARKWDLMASLVSIAGTLKWRLDNDLESLIRTGDTENARKFENFADQETSGKVFAFGSTVSEHPVIYVAVKKHLTSGQPEETMQKYILYAVESYRLLMMPPADKVSLIFDLEGFGLRNMDWQTLLFVLSVLEKYYPECLGNLYVMNAPWVFYGVWRGLAPMLDPVVRSKVQFIDRADDAAQVIPLDRFLAGVGGKAQFTYHCPQPRPGENDLLQDTAAYNRLKAKRDEAWIDFAAATLEWCHSPASSDAVPGLEEKRRLLAKKIRIAHWDLEPYYRPQTTYDRLGVADRRGLVHWTYPQSKSSVVLRQICGRAYAAPTLRREVSHVEQHGLSVDEAEDQTHKAIEKQDWVTLYGSYDVAVEVEGVDHVRSPPDATMPQQDQSAPSTTGKEGTTAQSTFVPPATSARPATSPTDVAQNLDTTPIRPEFARRDSCSSIQSAESFASAFSEVPESSANAQNARLPGSAPKNDHTRGLRRLPGRAYRQIGGLMALEVGQEETSPPPGTPGNLSEEQEQALQQFWSSYFECQRYIGCRPSSSSSDPENENETLTDNTKEALDSLSAAYGPSGFEHFWEFVKMDNPDSLVLRFLRARKWDVSDAIVMMVDCIKWRLDYDVQGLVQRGDLGNAIQYEKFLDQQRVAKTYAQGTTAHTQQPICYIHVAKHLTSGQPPETMDKFVVYAMETFRLLMSPPQEKTTLFFDLTGFGLKNMDWNTVGFIIKCFESFYPECLGMLFVHNAPWLFSGIWRGIAPMLDPVVRSKIIFSSSAKDCAEVVPPGRLLAALGGNVDNAFHFLEPIPGENALLEDQEGRESAQARYSALATEYEDVTQKWVLSRGEDPAVKQKRAMLVKQLRVAQYDLEPYVRGQTVYHRNGTLDGQGKVTWLYRQKDGHLIRHVVGRISCVGTLEREIAEMRAGATVQEVERKSSAALKAADWLGLYGDPAVANHLEGTNYPVDGGRSVTSVKQESSAAIAEAAAATAAAGNHSTLLDEAGARDPRFRAGSWSHAQPSTVADTARAFAQPSARSSTAPAGELTWTESMATSVTGMAFDLAETMSNLQEFALNAPGTLQELLGADTPRNARQSSPSPNSSRRLSSQLFPGWTGRDNSATETNTTPATASLRGHQRGRSSLSWSPSWFTNAPASSDHQYERISTTADLQAAATSLADHLAGTASEWTNGFLDTFVRPSSNPASPVQDQNHGFLSTSAGARHSNQRA